ncbi:MAG: hypothetical protein IPK81_18295 [Rhodospirillales bacterium]|nr:MAG: hypothetical protein IPK81_18295 [Rhodospirillales bacterium]
MTDDTSWKRESGVDEAVVNGRACRVVRYPAGSPMEGRFGCYLDGQFKGAANSADAARSRCRSLSGSGRTARDRINMRAWQPQ